MWSFSYQDQLRLRRTFWKELHFDPGSVSVAEKDARSDRPSAKINSLLTGIELEDVKVLQAGGQDYQDLEKFSHLAAKGSFHDVLKCLKTGFFFGLLAKTRFAKKNFFK